MEQEKAAGSSREQQGQAERGSAVAQRESQEGALAGQLELSQRDHGEEPELCPGEMKQEQEVTPGEDGAESEPSSGDTGSSQEIFDWEEDSEQERSPRDRESSQDSSEGWKEFLERWVAARELEEGSEGELSLGEALSFRGDSDERGGTEQGLFQGERGSSPRVSDWEECSQQELSPQEVGNYQEHSDWEESTGQELSAEQGCVGQEVSKGTEGKRASVHSSWEDTDEQELAQDGREDTKVQGVGPAASLQEDDEEWDGVSLLELCEQTYRERRLAGWAGGERPGLFPREAWVEPRTPQPQPEGSPCATPAPLQAQSPVAQAAFPGLARQVPEAGPQSPGPHEKRPSRFRRALRALRRLFRCPCPAARPED